MAASHSASPHERGPQPAAASYPAVVGFALGIISVLAMVLSGFGTRLGLWHFGTGFSILKWAAYGALTASVVSMTILIVALVQNRRRDLLIGIAGLVIGLSSAWFPWSWLQTARSVPPIHDISTDTANPPKFVAILPLRKDAPNSTDYEGGDLAEQQRTGYPDLAPVMLPEKPEIAFEKAVAAARSMGWTLVDVDSGKMRIEATDTTFWFGFKDDIVVRVVADGRGSRIDVRSVSRVGKSDVGTNAKRIREYIDRLE